MSTKIESIDANTSRLLVNSVEAMRFGPGGLPSLNGAQLAGHRRRTLNGGCDIAQAGASFAGLGTGQTWTLDGFQWDANSDSLVTVSQAADAPADNEFQSSLRVAVTTADASIATTQYAMINTHIEGYDVRDLIGKPITISFRVRSAKTGIHCLALRNSGHDRSYIMEYTVNTANTWETKTLTVPVGLITAGTWNWNIGTGLYIHFILACGTSLQASPANTWLTSNSLSTANQVNCLDTVGNIFAVTGVQLEPGSIATPYEHLKFVDDLLHAMRYYQVMTDSYGSGLMLNATEADIHIQLPVPMRTAPSVSVTFNGAGLQILQGGSTIATAQVQPGVLAPTLTSMHLDFSGTATGTGNSGAILRNAISGQKMAFSARLP